LAAFGTRQSGDWRYQNYIKRMVEAAGVEPASGKARNEKNYARIRFSGFGCRLRSGKNNDSLVRLISGFCYGPKLMPYSVK
jgi:hypothetical protein